MRLGGVVANGGQDHLSNCGLKERYGLVDALPQEEQALDPALCSRIHSRRPSGSGFKVSSPQQINVTYRNTCVTLPHISGTVGALEELEGSLANETPRQIRSRGPNAASHTIPRPITA